MRRRGSYSKIIKGDRSSDAAIEPLCLSIVSCVRVLVYLCASQCLRAWVS